MEYLMTVGLEDPLCDEAMQTFQEIDQNLNVRILTGDHIETAKSLAIKIGLITDQDSNDDFKVMESKQFREEIGEYTMAWDSQELQFKICIKDQSKFDRVAS